MSLTFAVCVVSLCCAVSCADDRETTPAIVNGDFTDWTDGEPEGWTVGIGARNGGDEPVSWMEPMDDGGLRLSGDARTLAWRFVSQTIPLAAGEFLRIDVEHRAIDLRREGGQFDNCYIGLALMNAAGERLSRQFITPADDWREEALYVRAPQQGEMFTAEITIFLSKSGSLELRRVAAAQLRPEDSLQLLVDDMDRNYSHFAGKQIDWQALTARYRERILAQPDEFETLAAEMLGELRDMHVWLVSADGRQVPSHRSEYTPNFRTRGPVAENLTVIADVPNLGYVARTSEGYGLIGIHSLSADGEAIRKFDAAIAQVLDAPGILIDLRRNSGGAEPLGQHIAGRFTDQPRAYAGSVVRNGPEHEDFSDLRLRYLQPRRDGEAYTKPIVCLIGPGCVSSGEGMAMMFKCLPHATLVGQPTRGASGNPQPLPLPNGIDVWYSRWVALLPDGTPIEGKGIAPDVVIEHREAQGTLDVTFERGVEILGERIAERSSAGRECVTIVGKETTETRRH